MITLKLVGFTEKGLPTNVVFNVNALLDETPWDMALVDVIQVEFGGEILAYCQPHIVLGGMTT